MNPRSALARLSAPAFPRAHIASALAGSRTASVARLVPPSTRVQGGGTSLRDRYAGPLRSYSSGSGSASAALALAHDGKASVQNEEEGPSQSAREELGGGDRGGGSRPEQREGEESSEPGWVQMANPRQLVAHLDSYVVGQARAKKILAVAVYNHYTRARANIMRAQALEEQRLQEESAAAAATEAALRRDHDQVRQAAAARVARQRKSSDKTSTKQNDAGKGSAPEGREDRKFDGIRLGKVMDVEGEAARRLRFGRRERDWLGNSTSEEGRNERWGSTSEGASAEGKGKVRSRDGILSDYALRERRHHEKREEEGGADEGRDALLSDYAGQTDGLRRGPNGEVLPDKPIPGALRTPRPPSSARQDPNFFGYFSPQAPELVRGRPERAMQRPSQDAVEADLNATESSQDALRRTEERAKRALEVVDTKLAPTQLPRRDGGSQKAADASGSNSTDTSAGVGAEPPDQGSALSLPVFEKSNVLILGPTGSGKTLMMRTLADVLRVPFVHVDATPFTQAGYVGEDVESCIHRLLQAAQWDVGRASVGIVCIDEVDKIARRPGDSASKDVSGEGVQQALLRMLEGTTITVTDKGGSSAAAGAGAAGAGGGASFDTANSSASQARRRTTSAGLPGHGGSAPFASSSGQGTTYHVDTSSVLFVLSGAFVGLEKVVQDRLARAAGDTSSASSNNAPTPVNDPKKGIISKKKDDLYELVEPQDLNAYGLIPEFVGRVPIVATLRELSEDDLLRVLIEPRNALRAQYESLFSTSNVTLRITTPALREVARQAVGKGTGARGLRRILEDVLLDAMYSAPGSSVRYVLCDLAAAKGERAVGLYSRGQRHAFWNAFEDEERGEAPVTPATAPSGNASASKVQQLSRRTSEGAALRRRLRPRLIRPSRVGNARLIMQS